MATTLLEALDRHAAVTPSALALNELTYADLRAASLRVAAQFRKRGLRPGARLVLYAENRLGFVLAYLGGMRAGGIVVPANVLYRAGELEHVLADADAQMICVSATSAPHLPALPGLSVIDLSEVEQWGSDTTLAIEDMGPLPDTDALALLIYTSGTTGRAKGAMLTHGNLGAIATQLNEAWRWTARDTLLLMLPLFHVHGLGAGLNGTLMAGGHVLLRERFDAAAAMATLVAGEATMFFGVPTMYVRFLELAPPGTRFASVRLFVSGSAALPAAVHEAFSERFGASILERYGSTEFGFALGNRYEGPRHAGTVGFPMPRVRVRVADADGRDVAAGEAGEVLVHGPNVTAGYWRNEAATEAAFVTDAEGTRWFRSGDLATFDATTGYTICGRLKDLIISGGFNIYPSEVEGELVRVPGIRAAAMIARPDDARGEVPVAFVEADDPFDEATVIAALRERLASFKVPKAIYRLDELPRNAMGKVEKPRLRALLASDYASGKASA
jgi:malonyl-CoA/methylmalonyl-CoA synthetase